jgi:DNA replication protein DnaC
MYESELDNALPAVPSGADGEFQESAYTPFKLVSWELNKERDMFKELLKTGNLYMGQTRRLLINSARTLFSDSKDSGFTYDECAKIQRQITSMEEMDRRVSMLANQIASGSNVPQSIIDMRISEFQDAAYSFYNEINLALQAHGQRFKNKTRHDQLESLQRIFAINKYKRFENKFGIPINLDIEVFARICERRRYAKLDNVFPIQGEAGFGKTTLAWALASTVAEKLGFEVFSVRDSFIFNESTEYAEERIREAEPGSVIVFDEFGNQANRRRFYQEGQIAFMDRIKLIRFHGLTIFACWPEIKELDSQLIPRITGIFDINERGTAQLRTFNRNPYTVSKEFKPLMAKNLIASTPEEGVQIAEKYDEMVRMRFKFYEIPHEKWVKEYEPFKEQANKMGRVPEKSSKKVADELYLEFLATKVPPDALRISYQQLKEFEREKAYALYFNALVRRIAQAIGKKKSEIFRMNESPKTIDDGYIVIDELVAEYLKRLRAQYQGAKENAKAD